MEDNQNTMKRVIIRWATTALVSGCAGLAGFALAGTAQADPEDVGGTSGRWCPGQELPLSGYPPHPKVWNMYMCHDWYTMYNADNDTWTVVEGIRPFA